mmetsp:Transcript_33223/g.45521  ORF Transcript_33223/g.45521 Transcript_33223/m.45521 type:complete len:147 (+) Transcript_33223:58-498(+)
MTSSTNYTLLDVKALNGKNEKVVFAVHNKVYDVTSFLDSHPGGRDPLLETAGEDATAEFDYVGHSSDAMKLMEQYCVGNLISGEGKSDLDSTKKDDRITKGPIHESEEPSDKGKEKQIRQKVFIRRACILCAFFAVSVAIYRCCKR